MSDFHDGAKAAGVGCLGLVALVIIGVLLVGAGHIFGFFSESAQVVKEQVGPRALLKKYEWFKDAAANLDKKNADITVYEGRFKGLDVAYKGEPRAKWARDDREQYNIWQSEVAGIKASYNALAAEYNSNMSKINFAFCNTGQLPAGATEALPREFRSYIDK